MAVERLTGADAGGEDEERTPTAALWDKVNELVDAVNLAGTLARDAHAKADVLTSHVVALEALARIGSEEP